MDVKEDTMIDTDNPDVKKEPIIIKMNDVEKESIMSIDKEIGSKIKEIGQIEIKLSEIEKERIALVEKKEKSIANISKLRSDANSKISTRLHMSGIAMNAKQSVNVDFQKGEIIVLESN